MSNKQRNSTTVTEPNVGIFWLVGGKLLFDTTPLSRAEDYGDFKIHPGNHISVWERFIMAKTVPAEMEYEEAPRGRVLYDVKNRQFKLLADRCILRRKEVLTRIRKEMQLPENTSESTDSHYRCFCCLQQSSTE
jgi:hypothetical protein